MLISVAKHECADHLDLLKEIAAITEKNRIEVTLGGVSPDGRQQCRVWSLLGPTAAVNKLQDIVEKSDVIESMEVTLEIQ